jgi:hypothetical protein
LPEELRCALHEVAIAAAASPDTVFSLEEDSVSFQPMAYDDLHITTLFVGPSLQRLKPEPLGCIRDRMCSSRMHPGDCSIQFAGLTLFPPGKHNLLVAHFKPSDLLMQRWLELREDTVSALRDAASVDVASMVLRDNPEWICHATLGKLRATTSQVGRVKESQLSAGVVQVLADKKVPLFSDMRVLIDSFSLCGQQPGCCSTRSPGLSFSNLPL